jgi:ParB/RepB/Spo0J family partition protein
MRPKESKNVTTIPLKYIKVKKESGETRHRSSIKPGSLQTLKFSIEHYGLLEPIIVNKVSETEYELLDGENRLTALAELGWEEVDVRFFENLDDVDKEVIELEANIVREDLNWKDRARASKRILNLEQKRALLNLPGRFTGHGFTQKDLAKKLGVSEAVISIDLGLADALEAFPEMESIEKRNDALRRMRRLKIGGVSLLGSSTELIIKHFGYNPEPIKFMETFENKSIDLWVTDMTDGYDEELLKSCLLKLNHAGQGIIFHTFMEFGALINFFRENNLYHKETPFQWRGPKENLPFSWFSTAVKEPSRNQKKEVGFKSVIDPTSTKEKPYELFVDLIGNFTLKQMLVVDPVCYSAGLVKACLDHRRNISVNCPNKGVYDRIVINVEAGR